MSGTEPTPEGTPPTPPPPTVPASWQVPLSSSVPPGSSTPPGGAYPPNLPPFGYPSQGPGAQPYTYPVHSAQPTLGRPAPETLTIIAFIAAFVVSPVGLVLGIVQTVRERNKHGRASGLALGAIWVGAGVSVVTFFAGILLALSLFAFSGFVASSGVAADSAPEQAPRSDTVTAEFCDAAQELIPLREPLDSLDADGYAEHVGDGGVYRAETEFMIEVATTGESLWDSAPGSIIGSVETLIDASWYSAEGFEGASPFDPQDLHDAQSAAAEVTDFAAEHCATP